MDSKYFKRREFACKCGCGFDTVDTDLLDILEEAREYFGEPITINSACRCPEHNENIGGSKNSQHKIGRAADITIAGYDNMAVQSYFETTYPDSLGIGSYNTFTHIDSRNLKARWNG